ncbi:hypothetical protein NOS3756_57730 (plasmid) [Nostoc sp. NIES-3756]|uniref:hypothetical protein n=1 Tax=Nostoc sp. NIES-3756 TaxID=1751286 RepID=UPI00072147EA|nr:hypothetical protein [Nostoc sp. NIES-3756]BAT56761.1 hypothetical protein NOS3756_57730 [Nostoc sp. NIES-3756]
MNNTEKLTQLAQQQNFDDRTVQIFDRIYAHSGIAIAQLGQTTVTQADSLILVLKQNDATPEFVKNLLVYSLTKGMPVYVIDHILNSDHDQDGRTLSEELFIDNTDPYLVDNRPQKSSKLRQVELEL